MKQYTCQHCGGAFGRRGKKTPQYCSRECHDNARRKYTERPCVQCGALFRPAYESQAHCSPECSRKTTQAKLSRKIKLTCQHCGIEFERSPALADGKFCSPKCYFEAKQVTKERQCDYCGNAYLPRAERSNSGYCSQECASQHRRTKGTSRRCKTCPQCGTAFIASHNPKQRFCCKGCANTSRRSLSYGKRRTKLFSPHQKVKIFARDGGMCVQCGSTKDLEADHIIAIRLGGSNHVSNGQTLCRACHVKKTAHDKLLIRANSIGR